MKKELSMQEKFTNYVMLDGKKSLAIKIMNDTFEYIKAKGQKLFLIKLLRILCLK